MNYKINLIELINKKKLYKIKTSVIRIKRNDWLEQMH